MRALRLAVPVLLSALACGTGRVANLPEAGGAPDDPASSGRGRDPGLAGASSPTDAGGEPGTSWVELPIPFRRGDAQEARLVDEAVALLRERGARRVALDLDVAEVGRCAIDAHDEFEATRRHREIIERAGRVVISVEERARLHALGAWLVTELARRGVPRDRITVRTNPEIGTSVEDVPPLTLIRPEVTLQVQVQVQVQVPTAGGRATGTDR